MNRKNDKIHEFYTIIRSHPVFTFISVIVLINLIMLFVQIPYWIGRNKGIPVDFTASDVLEFMGTMFVAFATLLLGLVAYTQNKNLNRINTDLIKIQNQGLIPVFEVSSQSVISSRKPIDNFKYKPGHINVSKSIISSKNVINIELHLYEENDFTIYEETTIKMMYENITDNLIKKMSVVKVKSNVIENGKNSVQREFDTTGFLGVNSTQRILRKNDDIGIFLKIITNGGDSENRLLKNISEFTIEMKVHSLANEHKENILISVVNTGIVDIMYDVV